MKVSFNMAFLQYPYMIYSLILCCLISIYYFYKKLKTRSSSLPTNWPLLGMTPSLLWNFHRFHDHITDILKESGDTFMFKGPWFTNNDMLVTSDPANFQYITTTNYHNYPKGPEHREIFDIIGDGIFNCDSKLWKLQRKTTMSLFNHAEFKKLVEQTMWNSIHKKLIPVLDYMSERGLETDLQNIFQRLTLDVITDLLVEYDPETLSVGLPDNSFDAAITKSQETIFYRHFLPKFYWKFMNRLQIGKEKHLVDASKLFDEVFYKFIERKQQKLLKVDSFENEQLEDVRLVTGFLRKYKEQPRKFIKDTLFTLMIAGRDTTSSALTWFFYLLTKNPSVEGKIYEEIHARLGMKKGEKWKTFGTKELEMLVYLHGALCEALRLFPPVPSNPRSPQEADTLPSGHQVHTHTRIILYSYAMGRMETIWGPDYLEFRPERWISEQGGIKHMPPYKFPAFLSGPRTCLGKDMSLTQMKMVAATIIYNYNFQVVEGHPTTQDPNSLILEMKHGLMVTLTKKI